MPYLLLIALLLIGAVGVLTAINIVGTRRNNYDLAIGRISRLVWRNRERAFNAFFFAGLIVTLIAVVLLSVPERDY